MSDAIHQILKRDGSPALHDRNKIKNALSKALAAAGKEASEELLEDIVQDVETRLSNLDGVETIQDLAEQSLMAHKEYEAAKAYILYRQRHSEKRAMARKLADQTGYPGLIPVLLKIEKDFDPELYSLQTLEYKYRPFYKPGMLPSEAFAMLEKAAVELTTAQSPKWEEIAGRILVFDLEQQVESRMKKLGITSFYDKLVYLTKENLLGEYILENYSKSDIEYLYSCIDRNRNNLLSYASADLLARRYLITNYKHQVLETPQEMFLLIGMHLALPESSDSGAGSDAGLADFASRTESVPAGLGADAGSDAGTETGTHSAVSAGSTVGTGTDDAASASSSNESARVYWAREFYNMLSELKVTMATPIMASARKKNFQMSSCFVDTMEDSLNGIYKSLDTFAQVSKRGGGMGIYMGKVRAAGSALQGFEGAAGGIIRWTKLINDTAVAVDQLGVRAGAAAVYLDAWHMDLPEFLQLRTNNGDDRMKAHDIFPAVCYPDLFWKMAKEDLDLEWHMLDPHDIWLKKGYHLEDYYGAEWEKRYLECVNDPNILKRTMSMRDIIRMIIKSQAETGTPFIFNRDTVNKYNPNSHKGMIYASNLCTEICQNMSAMITEDPKIVEVNGETVVTQTMIPGDFVTCTLASLSLGRINVDDDAELEKIIYLAVRALDNVIDLNRYPIPYAKITSDKYRPIGLGTSGYQHLLAKKHIPFENPKHLEFMNALYEKINFYTLKASCSLSKERGAYEYFPGSDYATGKYFEKRSYFSNAWQQLEADIQKNGLRNGYLLAIAPTSSTSIIANTTPGLDPIIHKFYLEEKKGAMIPRVAPDLANDTFWYYKNAHYIDMNWVVDAAAIRQRHIDQAQSVNLYITNDYTFRKILRLYIRAWEKGVKTLYYVRSRSLEVEACESCSA